MLEAWGPIYDLALSLQAAIAAQEEAAVVCPGHAAHRCPMQVVVPQVLEAAAVPMQQRAVMKACEASSAIWPPCRDIHSAGALHGGNRQG